MAELTTALVDGALVEKSPWQQSIASARHLPAAAFGEELRAKPDHRVNEQTGRPPEQRKNGMAKARRQPSAYAKAAEDYRDKAFELMSAQVNATLQYAQQLANVRSPAELVELTTKEARKRFELIMTHTAAIGALSYSLTTSNAERMVNREKI